MRRITPGLSLLLLLVFNLAESHSAYGAFIAYKQTMTKILEEDQFTGWPADYETYGRSFNWLTTDAEGTRIGFRVSCNVGNNWYRHIYTADGEGSGITDLTAGLPGSVDSSTVSFLQVDQSGNRLFFRAPSTGNYTNIYYFTLNTNACAYAISPESGEDYALTNSDFRKPYSLTTIGDDTYLYFKHDDGWDNDAKRYNRGIYTAALGGLASKVLDIDQLSGDQNMNLLNFLGSAASSPLNLFVWNTDYYNPPARGMYKTAGPTRIPDEAHIYVWAEQDAFQHLISDDGSKALYQYSDGSSRSLYSVNTNSGAKTFLNQTNDLNGYYAPTMSPSGAYAFFSNMGNKRTRINLATGEQRDTFAYHFKESNCTSVNAISDITADDRYYFMASDCDYDTAKIYRIDMAPTDFTQTPNINAIDFTPEVLLNDGTSKVTVTAKISDPQGLDDISTVKMWVLVDGLEDPEWMNYSPISYSWTLYDDGANGGDQVAGDGIFTNNTIKASLSSNFYEKFQLPGDIGIRIVAKDQDANYVLADTLLRVGPLFLSQENITLEPGGSTVIDITGSGATYSVSNSDTQCGNRVHFRKPTHSHGNKTRHHLHHRQ